MHSVCYWRCARCRCFSCRFRVFTVGYRMSVVPLIHASIIHSDNALPGSRWWKQINSYTQTPVNAVWLVMLIAGICGVLGFSVTALNSLAGFVSSLQHLNFCSLPNLQFVNSSAVIGLYTSYTFPIFLSVIGGREKITPGPFTLGRLSKPIGWIAVTWVTFIVIMLLFPPGSRTTGSDMSTYLTLL